MLHLPIVRGAPLTAFAWPLTDSVGNPLRDPAGVGVLAAARAWPGAATAHVFATSVVLLTVAGSYGDEPVVAAQLDAMTPEQTAALPDLDGHLWTLAVGAHPVATRLIAMDWAVSRA